MKTPNISIALCTYNGEKYLQEQLDSFVRQTLLPYELVACDDCSSDSTVEILEDFSKTAPFPVRIFRNEHNFGLIKNFSKAASLCTGEYVAFSDQDDIWLPDKLEACFRAMEQAEKKYGADIPLLVHSDLSLIDSTNHIITKSFMKLKRMKHEASDPLRTLLIRNFVSGCTSLCNKALLRESLPFPEVMMNHDGWVAMIAASRGKILFIPEPKVLRRIHESNVTGLSSSPYKIREFIKRRLNPGKADANLLGLLNQAKELQKRLTELSSKIPPYLNRYINALQKGGVINAFMVMFSLKARAQGLIPNLPFYYFIAKGNHIKLINK